jgi:hypothetical protein
MQEIKILFSDCCIQQQLMYCLMMDQLGPKRVGVESLKILILLYIIQGDPFGTRPQKMRIS